MSDLKTFQMKYEGLDLEAIKKTAHLEYEQERFKKAVEEYKAKLKSRNRFWDRLWPWKIIVLKKERL